MPALQDRLAAEMTAARKAGDGALTLLLETILAMGRADGGMISRVVREELGKAE